MYHQPPPQHALGGMDDPMWGIVGQCVLQSLAKTARKQGSVGAEAHQRFKAWAVAVQRSCTMASQHMPLLQSNLVEHQVARATLEDRAQRSTRRGDELEEDLRVTLLSLEDVTRRLDQSRRELRDARESERGQAQSGANARSEMKTAQAMAVSCEAVAVERERELVDLKEDSAAVIHDLRRKLDENGAELRYESGIWWGWGGGGVSLQYERRVLGD